MKIHLEELDHQEEALKALLSAMPKLDEDNRDLATFANPLLQGAGIEDNFIDIKMETGTGKTYVYTRTMYELNKCFGLFKFVIVVPNLAIKEGTRNFIEGDYARQHFSKPYPNKRIELQIISGGDFSFKRGRRKNFPAALTQFCESDRNERNIIQCLLINTQMLMSKGFCDEDYDQTLFGDASCPMDAVAATQPIVIIDEPHRIKRDSTGYKAVQSLKPQLIIRFGATFPEMRQGRGRNAIVKPDYYRGTPQYNLGAVEAFNQDLVKGVSIQFPNLPESAANRFRVKNISARELILTQRSGEGSNIREFTIKPGEDLSAATAADFGGISYEGSKKLSNELELETGMELVSGVFTNTYQELLLSQAINTHFEVEQANFHRQNNYKVKTNALFFIDSIASYRDSDGWLKQKFEELLRKKLDQLLSPNMSNSISPEYRDYLQATKENLALSHGGYFARDWGEPDDSATAEERDDILHKERTLPFKRSDGSWNIRRFFFSKWTLREGWDNPNVFTICKLRTSGSEISKIQEVGRGLRLPVDEMGNRLRGSEWQLNYIIGWDERNFAEKLVGEINEDAQIQLNRDKLTTAMREIICKTRNIDELPLLVQLQEQKIIKSDTSFEEGGYEKLLQLYPELLLTQVRKGKITVPGNRKNRPKIKLRKNNWAQIADFWKDASRRYLLHLERLPETELQELIANVLQTENLFEHDSSVTITVTDLIKQNNELSLAEKNIIIDNPGLSGKLHYGEFVRRLASRTALPVPLLHQKLWLVLQQSIAAGKSQKEINDSLNHNTLEKTVKIWHEKFAETYAARYDYYPLNFTAETSVIRDNSFVDEIEAGDLGKNTTTEIADDDRNLYEMPRAYDSEIEREIQTIEPIREITVFGKIPRRAIKVPTYTGGSTTPDFIYCIADHNKAGGKANEHVKELRKGYGANVKCLTLLIETKADDMRGTEKRAIAAQEKLFKNIPGVKWRLITSSDDFKNLFAKLIP